jgi:hypothetical protein
MVLLPCVSAQVEQKETLGIVASPQQVGRINELWGQDISVGEYFENVYPDELKAMPEPVKNDMYKQKMSWGRSDRRTVSSGISTDKLLSNFIDVTATFSKSSTGIYYHGRAITSSPVSYLYVEAYLKNDAQQVVSSTSWHVAGSDVLAYNNVYYPASDSYYVHAWGYAPSPYMEDSMDTGYFNFP